MSNREAVTHWWQPGRKLLAALRAYQHWNARPWPLRLLRKPARLRWIFWSAIAGADIPLECEIGPGLLIPHPNGIVIHRRAKIGANCCIFQQVTLGEHPRGLGVPTIGDGVTIGAGAKIFGDIHITSDVRANAVVTPRTGP